MPQILLVGDAVIFISVDTSNNQKGEKREVI
jgi:hypothetical protein